MIQTALVSQASASKMQTDLNPVEVYKAVKNLIQRLWEKAEQRNQGQSVHLFSCYLRLTLASKEICVRHRFSKEILNYLIPEIEARYMKSMVHPGEAIGAIAAQSVGEPTT